MVAYTARLTVSNADGLLRPGMTATADIITMSPALIQKMLEMKELDLNLLSIMTVKQFSNDAKGITL